MLLLIIECGQVSIDSVLRQTFHPPYNLLLLLLPILNHRLSSLLIKISFRQYFNLLQPLHFSDTFLVFLSSYNLFRHCVVLHYLCKSTLSYFTFLVLPSSFAYSSGIPCSHTSRFLTMENLICHTKFIISLQFSSLLYPPFWLCAFKFNTKIPSHIY